jgi:hypothetical protein
MNFEIHLKGGFSERKGYKKFSDKIQVESLDDRTRNLIYNLVVEKLLSLLSNATTIPYQGNMLKKFVEYLYMDTFSETVDNVPNVDISFGVEKLIKDITGLQFKCNTI